MCTFNCSSKQIKEISVYKNDRTSFGSASLENEDKLRMEKYRGAL